MSRVRVFVVGRQGDCDLIIDAHGVARRHAEVILLADGRCHVTDRGTRAGTFVMRDSSWHRIRQAFIAPGESLRFGAHQTTVTELHRLAEPTDPAVATPPLPRAAARGSPDPGSVLFRDPQTGEIVERSPG